jgi:hypothetical protein
MSSNMPPKMVMPSSPPLASSTMNAHRRHQRRLRHSQRKLYIIATAATHCHRPHPTRTRCPHPRNRILKRAAKDGAATVATIGVVQTERGRSISCEDQGILLVKHIGSATATDIGSII